MFLLEDFYQFEDFSYIVFKNIEKIPRETFQKRLRTWITIVYEFNNINVFLVVKTLPKF